MKKLISLLLCIIIVASTFPLTVAATDDELCAKDMFTYELYLEDAEVNYWLERCKYTPIDNDGYLGCFGGTYTIGYYSAFPIAGGYYTAETSEELLQYFYGISGLKKEFFEKYTNQIQFVNINYYKNSSGKYYRIEYYITFNEAFVNEVETYGSYEKAYFYAKLYAILSGEYLAGAFNGTGYTFEEYYRSSEFEYGDILPFDANYDGSINSRDVLILKRAIAGHDVQCNYSTRDLNGDGVTNAKDMLYLNTYAKTGVDLRK